MSSHGGGGDGKCIILSEEKWLDIICIILFYVPQTLTHLCAGVGHLISTFTKINKAQQHAIAMWEILGFSSLNY